MSREQLTKIILPEEKLPRFWYNVQADMPTPLSPGLNPQTKQPLTPADLEPLFARELIMQEVSTERYIEIPQEVREIYKQWRPSPLFRAHGLEKALDTSCHIYYKYEGVSPVGSHKLNSALPQVFYNKAQGIKRLTTETGAGQWGTALSLACKMYDLEAMVYMVKVSYYQKPYRRVAMEVYGARCVPSPSPFTESGRKALAQNPDMPGTLGLAISEAVEDAAGREDTNYSLGSVLNHVCLHQSVIGQEVKLQLEMVDEYPTLLLAAAAAAAFRRYRLSLHPRQIERQQSPAYSGRTGRLPDIDPRGIRLRLWRCGRVYPVAENVHPGQQFQPARNTRRGLALSRRVAPGKPVVSRWAD